MQFDSFYRLLSISSLLLLAGCFPPYEPIDEQHWLDQESGLRFSTFDGDGDRQAMFVVESGQPDKQMVLFIHGTPGSWQGYAEYLQNTALSARAHLVAMGRVEIGQSDHGHAPRSSNKPLASSACSR